MSQDLVTFKLYSKHIEPVKPSARSPGQSICVERSCINLILHFGATSCSQLCSGTQQSDDLVSGESPQSPASVFSPGALQTCQLRLAQPQSTGRQTSRQNIHGSFTAKSKQKHYFSPETLRRWTRWELSYVHSLNCQSNCGSVYKTQSSGW